jgi:hypothetical protein
MKLEKINGLKHEQKPSFKVVDISNCPYGVVRNILYYRYMGLEPPATSGLARSIGEVTRGGG